MRRNSTLRLSDTSSKHASLLEQEENNQLMAQMAADETVSRGVVEELKSKVKSGQAFLEQKERLEFSMKQLQDSLNTERSDFARKFRCVHACCISSPSFSCHACLDQYLERRPGVRAQVACSRC